MTHKNGNAGNAFYVGAICVSIYMVIQVHHPEIRSWKRRLFDIKTIWEKSEFEVLLMSSIRAYRLYNFRIKDSEMNVLLAIEVVLSNNNGLVRFIILVSIRLCDRVVISRTYIHSIIVAYLLITSSTIMSWLYE